MTYSIEVLRSADKFLAKLSRQQPADAAALEDAIEGLGEQPRPPGSTALRGYPQVWRIRVGNYRICYQVLDRALMVLVITVGTRDNVYEILGRQLGR